MFTCSPPELVAVCSTLPSKHHKERLQEHKRLQLITNNQLDPDCVSVEERKEIVSTTESTQKPNLPTVPSDIACSSLVSNAQKWI